METKKINNTGMARMNDLKQTNTKEAKKQAKKEKKKEKEEEKLNKKKNKIMKDTAKTEKIYKSTNENDIETAKSISSFSKGHSTYTLR